MVNNLNISSVTLNNGVSMPLLGLGTYLLSSGRKAQNALINAIEVGYRFFDTAAFYGNERDCGEAVRNSGLPREAFFVTTKLWNDAHGYDEALFAFDKSMERLGLEVLDLYLIHYPVLEKRKQSWKALEHLYEQKRVRAIGVSNYMIRHLEELETYANIPPAVNQVEFSPFLHPADLLNYCFEHTIHLQAYSSLTRSKRFGDQVISGFAEKYGKTPAQILLRWAVQKKVSVIPKSCRRERMIENATIFDFEIEKADMELLDGLDEGYHVSWDPSEAP